jgi:isocitrate dehydrogenase
VQQFVKEGHLRWDSLGEYCALVPALELMGTKTGSPRAALLSKTLDEDGELKQRFTPVAAALEANDGKITQELMAAQGKRVEIGGYYFPDDAKCAGAMRPSVTLNAIIDGM